MLTVREIILKLTKKWFGSANVQVTLCKSQRLLKSILFVTYEFH